MKKWVCTVCGYVHEGETAPEFCPVCKVPAEKFKLQEEDMRVRSLIKHQVLRCCALRMIR